MQYYMSVSEIQDRVKILISHFQNRYNKKAAILNSRFFQLLQQGSDPNLLNNERVADEVITAFLNSIILAGQLGIDIEAKINEYLIQLEREALVAM